MKYEDITVGKTYANNQQRFTVVYKDDVGILVIYSDQSRLFWGRSVYSQAIACCVEYKEPVYKYFNMYKGQTGPMRNTKELAINNISLLVGYLGTYKIDIESGEITKVS